MCSEQPQGFPGDRYSESLKFPKLREVWHTFLQCKSCCICPNAIFPSEIFSSICRETRKGGKNPKHITYALYLSCCSTACPRIPLSAPEFPSSAPAEQLRSGRGTLLEQRNTGLEDKKISIHRLTAAAVFNKRRQLIKESTRRSCPNSSSWTEDRFSRIQTKKK